MKLIVGSGDVASAVQELDNDNPRLYFASGVSNSRETREKEYQREIDLLLAQDKRHHLVYFSSLAVLNSDTRYIRHKYFMEILVKGVFPHHTIVRIGNISWGSNPHTLINFIRTQMEAGKKPQIKDEYRYVVDKPEFLYWLDQIPDWPCEMNIPGRRLKVKEIVDEYIGLPKKKV